LFGCEKADKENTTAAAGKKIFFTKKDLPVHAEFPCTENFSFIISDAVRINARCK
jgi:hypothetical protein